jgi:hypothetical protein
MRSRGASFWAQPASSAAISSTSLCRPGSGCSWPNRRWRSDPIQTEPDGRKSENDIRGDDRKEKYQLPRGPCRWPPGPSRACGETVQGKKRTRDDGDRDACQAEPVDWQQGDRDANDRKRKRPKRRHFRLGKREHRPAQGGPKGKQRQAKQDGSDRHVIYRKMMLRMTVRRRTFGRCGTAPSVLRLRPEQGNEPHDAGPNRALPV